MTENNALKLIALANELESMVQTCIPDCHKVAKYGGTLFTLKPEEKEGQFCGVFVYSAHVQLSFSNGPALKDERKILCGNGKYRRHINFKSIDEIDYDYINNLILQASKL